MRLLVCGGRNFSEQAKLNSVLDRVYEGFNDNLEDILINGDASGADKLSTMWATLRSKDIKLELYPVTQEEWQRFGKYAGIKRNTRMAAQSTPDVAVVFKGASGTRHMLTQLHLNKCPYIIIIT